MIEVAARCSGQDSLALAAKVVVLCVVQVAFPLGRDSTRRVRRVFCAASLRHRNSTVQPRGVACSPFARWWSLSSRWVCGLSADFAWCMVCCEVRVGNKEGCPCRREIEVLTLLEPNACLSPPLVVAGRLLDREGVHCALMDPFASIPLIRPRRCPRLPLCVAKPASTGDSWADRLRYHSSVA